MIDFGRHIFYFKNLAEDPAVTARLNEIEAEVKKAGEEICTYIEVRNLQL